MIRFAENLKCLPILSPAATTADAGRGSEYVDMRNVQWLSVHALFGAMTSDSTDTITVTVQCSTAASSNATELNVPFSYRLSSAIATDDQGAITAATAAAGVVISATDDDKLLQIEVDPTSIPSLTNYTNHRYVRVFFDPSDAIATAYSVGAVAYIEPRYKGNEMPSST